MIPNPPPYRHHNILPRHQKSASRNKLLKQLWPIHLIQSHPQKQSKPMPASSNSISLPRQNFLKTPIKFDIQNFSQVR